jgi:perosamine synthetase
MDEILASRENVALRYSELLSGHAMLQSLENDPRMKRSWFVYIIRFQSQSPASLRERVRASLREKGIATQIYFTPIHLQPFYQQCQAGNIPSLPRTEQAAEECLAVPFHTRLSEMEIKYVCDAINQAMEPQKPESTAVGEPIPLVSPQLART